METDICDARQGIDYEPARDAYRMRADPGDSVCIAVVELVGTVLDRDPVDLPPLHGWIDTDALDSLFRTSADDPSGPRGFVAFEYVGCEVRAYADGEVVVRRLDQA